MIKLGDAVVEIGLARWEGDNIMCYVRRVDGLSWGGRVSKMVLLERLKFSNKPEQDDILRRFKL